VVQQKLQSFASAVNRLTGLPAKNFKLAERGCLNVGCFADVAVFVPEQIRENATFIKPHALSTGMDFVLVNGVTVIENGVHMGAKPGRVVRRGAAQLAK
jgi:N-acyl-D-amino-acid deacylase